MSIIRREFAARRDLLVLAAAVMIIAVMMPLMPGTGNYGTSDVRSLASQVLALMLGYSVAIGLGISVFGSDLSAGRLGFFFARPVTTRAIWVGRMLAALAIVFACEAIVIVPAVVAEGAQLVHINPTGWWAIVSAFVLMPIILCLASHALSVMGRARSAWLLLDLAGLVAVAVGSWLAIRPLIVMGAIRAVVVVSTLLAVAAAAALAIAGWAGLAVGRTDLRRTHGAMSIALWSLLGVAVACLLVSSGWLRGFGPAQMDDVEVFSVAPDGGWIEVWGSAPWRLDVRRHALVSSSTDRFLLLPMSWTRYQRELVFSVDGRTVVGLGLVAGPEKFSSLWWSDLEAHDLHLQETTIVVSGRATPSLSPSGSRIAILDAALLSVYELESEHLLTAISIPQNLQSAVVFFVDEGRLLMFARHGREDDAPLHIARVDVESGHLAEITPIEDIAEYPSIVVDADVSYFFVSTGKNEEGTARRQLHDAKTGAKIRDFNPKDWLRFLADGHIVAFSETEDGRTFVAVESVDGSERVEHDLGVVPGLRIHGEAIAGSLVVSRLEDPGDWQRGRIAELLDLETGDVRRVAEGVNRGYSPTQHVWARGLSATRCLKSYDASCLFEDSSGAIVRLNPQTGDLVHIIGGAK
jgi:hypothetical protein